MQLFCQKAAGQKFMSNWVKRVTTKWQFTLMLIDTLILLETHQAEAITNDFSQLLWTPSFKAPVAVSVPQLILEFIVSGINNTGLCCSTCITGLVIAVVCRALSLRLVIMLHYCVIYREHNGVWNNSWGPWKQLCLSLRVFAYRLFCA